MMSAVSAATRRPDDIYEPPQDQKLYYWVRGSCSGKKREGQMCFCTSSGAL
jgi:hypothetical protein